MDYLLISILGAVALAFLGGVGAGLTYDRWQFGTAVAGGLMLSSASAGWLAYRLIRRKASVNCYLMTRAATYLGSVGPCHTFDLKSGFYAADFVRANHRKLVNVSPRVASILRGTKFGEHQVPRRLVRSR